MAVPPELIAELRARFPVFAEIAPTRWPTLGEQLALHEAAEGSVLFEPGKPCTGFPLVLEGSVRVVKASENGREIVLYRVSPGEGCLLSGACLLGQTDYGARGIAETPVRLVMLPPQAFNELIVHEPAFRRFVFDAYGTRLAEVIELIDEVAFRKLDTRLARLLVQRGPLIAATHQQLADELGSVRVFVSRLLRSFEERGWVKLERERVTVLDARALLAFATG